ncbi:hypothetical protein [Secundilactobacillus collinoides]|uniref:hypothetical protein n=1 Tax=Secundilactobacillus collinoides TaxID=33960 RepID=UPI0006D29D3E|nr:hypothetical protein [Secundilactobacillus collinoides]
MAIKKRPHRALQCGLNAVQRVTGSDETGHRFRSNVHVAVRIRLLLLGDGGGKGWLFYRYSKLRINEREVTDDPDFALSEYFSAGLFFIGLGAIFAVFCLSMYFNGYHQHFSANVTYIIALIGFVKIINSSISLVRSRKHHNHLITILKLFNVVDGAVAIVLTQYAILTLERSANANSSSGLFGFGIGIVIVILGVWFLVRSRQRGAANGRQGLDDEHR